MPSLQETGYGNVARNSFYGPGYFDIDATLFKNFPIRERMKLSVGAQAFNLMNHPQLRYPELRHSRQRLRDHHQYGGSANQSLRPLRRLGRLRPRVGAHRSVHVLIAVSLRS